MQGLLAYVDEKPVAWCHYERKSALPGLKVFYQKVLGDDGQADNQIAAIVCFTVAQGYRGKGIATQLLTVACQDLATQDYATVEAYPCLEDRTDEHNYHGPLSMYLASGFTVFKEIEKQIIVRKSL